MALGRGALAAVSPSVRLPALGSGPMASGSVCGFSVPQAMAAPLCVSPAAPWCRLGRPSCEAARARMRNRLQRYRKSRHRSLARAEGLPAPAQAHGHLQVQLLTLLGQSAPAVRVMAGAAAELLVLALMLHRQEVRLGLVPPPVLRVVQALRVLATRRTALGHNGLKLAWSGCGKSSSTSTVARELRRDAHGFGRCSVSYTRTNSPRSCAPMRSLFFTWYSASGSSLSARQRTQPPRRRHPPALLALERRAPFFGGGRAARPLEVPEDHCLLGCIMAMASGSASAPSILTTSAIAWWHGSPSF
mmetsp:Transcript_16694/g.35390  ORF Transcript_16694/g.35390 Transcript_16694/m.35390 type:complete len:303 (-) Transcript_16694:7-915(-)